MNTAKKMLSLLAAAALSLGVLTATVSAGDTAAPTDTSNLDVLVDECFDDYTPGYAGKSTTLADHFIVDANQIGGGCVQVEEDTKTGNLFLLSHVFTQVYSTTPLEDGYTFSLDVFSTQGAQNCAVFLRAPLIEGFPYYETDGYAGGQTACVAGLVFNFQINSFSVNVKSFDPAATANYGVKENMFTFTLPEGVIFNDGIAYTNFKVVDDTNEIKLYVEDVLVGRITLSGIKNGYSSEYFTQNFYETVVVYNAEGTELGTVQNTLVESGNAIVGWSTRVANMLVDNIYLAVPAAEETTVPETEAPTVPETESPTVPETDAPTMPETEAPTMPETEAPTMPETDAPTLPETDAPTSPETDTPTAPETDAPTADETDASTTIATETKPADTEPADDTGCFSSLALGGILPLLAAAALVLSKRK